MKAIIGFFRKLFKREKKNDNSNSLNEANLPVLLSKDRKNHPEKEIEKNIDAYRNITQIDTVIGKNIISFKKINIQDIEKNNYQEITSDRIKGGLSNIVSAGSQIAAISALNPSGLFSATVSPQLLTLFSNGTFSTMVHQGGHIAAHAGFQSISATVFAPIAIMQLLSMITGQYYMNGITKQLKNIDKKINQLIKFHHTEKIARLENAQVLLRQLADLQYPGIEHLTQLKGIETETGSIYREYLKYLTDSKDAISKIKDIWNWSSQKYFDKLFSIDDDSGFSLNFYMVTTSDEILHLIPIIEFMLNVKMNIADNNRNNQIREIYNKIEKYSSEDFFANSSGKKLLKIYYDPFIYEAKKILEQTWFHQDECERRIKEMEKRKEDIKKNILGNAETLKIKDELVKHMKQPIEILYSINDDEGKGLVYIKQ